MEVRVHGKNVQLSESIKDLAMSKVTHAGRIFDSGGSADVEFAERHNPRRVEDRMKVEITSRVAGHTVRVESDGPDDRTALDGAIAKFERQLRKLKERLVQRSRVPKNKRLNEPAPSSDEMRDVDGPTIVRTKRFVTRPMTAEEAALEMEMLGHDFFLFLDAETGKHAVLYHRNDGSLGLIEPE